MEPKKWILRGVGAYQRRRDLSWRRLPKFDVLPAGPDTAVYYVAPEERAASGGVRVIYRHVDELNALGIPAAVVHPHAGFRADWFKNDTRVVPAARLRLRQNDILVVPECYAPGLLDLPDDVRLVVFNQGPHHTFDRIRLRKDRPGSPYTDMAGLESILTVSDDGAALLRMAFPDVPVRTARNVVDKSVFHGAEDRRQRVVSYVPSRRSDELHQLLHLLNARAEFNSGEWELKPLHGLTEAGMADALRGSSIFLSLSHRDGFGLPPAEAMACGAYVVGHPGGGGTEFFDPAYCSPAHDNTQIMRAVVEAMAMPESQRRELAAKASARILGHYTADGLRADLTAFYGSLR